MDAFSRAARKKAMLRLHEYQIDFSPEKTLVIIDMQSLFINEDEIEIIPNIILLIQHAMGKKWAIIVVENDGSGDTDEEITQTLQGYPHKETVTKYENNGGLEVIQCVQSHPTWSIHLIVCGIYGDECVSETVAGLFDHSDVIEVDVVSDAICPAYMSSSEPDDYDQQKEFVTTMEELGISTIEGSVV